MASASGDHGPINSHKGQQHHTGVPQVVRTKRVQSRFEHGASLGMRLLVVGE